MVKTPAEKVAQTVKNLAALIEMIKVKITKPASKDWKKSTISKTQGDINDYRNRLENAIESAGNDCNSTQYDQVVAQVAALSVILDELETVMDAFPANADASTAIVPQPTAVKLPTIDLPSFDGHSNNWLQFHDIFKASIHSRQDIPGAQKMQYLVSSLKGEALSLLRNVPVSNDNYQQAWNIVTNRYNKKHVLISAQCKILFGQPSLKSDCPDQIRKLLDTTGSCVATLKKLGAPTEHWDIILTHLVFERLDDESKKMWEMQKEITTTPTFDDLTTFLERRADALTSAGPSKPKPQYQGPKSNQSFQKKVTVAAHTSTKVVCNVCNGDHLTYKCEKLQSSSLPERKNLVQQKGLCSNCLLKGHSSSDCKSKYSCHKCQGRHNTVLHEDSKPSTASNSKTVSSAFAAKNHDSTNVLLKTALVKIVNPQGQSKIIRALIDSGSESSFITENCIQFLNLKTCNVDVKVEGIGSTTVAYIKKGCTFKLQSCTNSFSMKAFAYVMPGKITRSSPSASFTKRSWPHIKKLELADPTYHTSAPIDLLIGANLYNDITLPGKRRGKGGTPAAYRSVFGWLLIGSLPLVNHQASTISANLGFVSLDECVQRFWELEEVPSASTLTAEEQACEEHFESTHIRRLDGTHEVQLPFHNDRLSLGSSRQMALKRFLSVEKRLILDPIRQQQYRDFMAKYLNLGHMRKVTPDDASTSDGRHYYLPHHHVVKDSSTTTKLRVVFDASAKTSSGVSLNQKLMVGPTIQDTIMNHIMRFRTHIVALTADVEKMYRQVAMNPIHTPYQRILWRDDPSEPIEEYELLTVTYGTASAPYLATKALQHFTPDEEAKYPHAAEVVRRDFYVDDLMSGESTTDSAIRLKDDLIDLLQSGGFKLRKWSSNDPAVLASIPPEWRETLFPLSLDKDDSVKTLGLKWHPGSDRFTFSVSWPNRTGAATKRTLLSDTARLFDPMGWLAPITIKAKIMFQALWKESKGWDESLPYPINEEWSAYTNELTAIENLSINRCIAPSGSSHFQLHGFADASQTAYAAVVYLRSTNPDGSVNLHLVSSKTKVAPINSVSIPRLELCAALLLAKLMKAVKLALHIPIEELHAWSDSTITLCWLSSDPCRWKTFVANRVARIHSTLPNNHWHHVKGTENPADCASRGLYPSELQNHPLWWNGPSWLREPTFSCQEHDKSTPAEALLEEKRQIVQQLHVAVNLTMLDHCSSLLQLQRRTAYWLRFIQFIRKQPPKKGQITVQEYQNALHLWIRKVQNAVFATEIHCLMSNKPLSKKSRLLPLNPFVDSTGILRVGGRLRNAPISPGRRHPILLPQNHHLTDLIITQKHHSLLHAGPQLLLASLQQQYWIIN